MILVQKDADLSFMPFRRQRPELDLSRFDTGGVENAKSAQQLSAYLFSDRGIYRPGETTHLGLITRTADWKSSLAGLPLEVEITDSRGTVVSRNQLTLSAAVFDEVAYTSQTARRPAPIRRSRTSVKDEKTPRDARQHVVQGAGVRAGPDESAARARGRAECDGWLQPDDVKARITVAHLFGEPARRPARRGGVEPDAGAAALRALSGPSLPDRRVHRRSRSTKRSPRARHRRQRHRPNSSSTWSASPAAPIA